MQWTVRYFLNKAEKWKIGGNSESIAVGAKAYTLRQEARWRMMALNSDNTFKKQLPIMSHLSHPFFKLFNMISISIFTSVATENFAGVRYTLQE